MRWGRLRTRSAVVLVAGGLSVAFVAQGQQPTFRDRVDAVRVDVLVSRGGVPVAGLSARDFELRDRGVVQRVDAAEVAGTIDVGIVLNRFRNYLGEEPRQLPTAAATVLGLLQRGDRGGVVTYADAPRLEAPLAPTSGTLRQNLLRAPEVDKLATLSMWEAILAGASLLAESRGRSLLIVLSDGIAYRGWITEDEVIETLAREDILVYVIRMSQGPKPGLHRLAQRTGGRVFFVRNQDEWPRELAQVFERLRSRYVLTYTPTGVGRDDGWHRLDVRVRIPGARVEARRGYFAEPRDVRAP